MQSRRTRTVGVLFLAAAAFGVTADDLKVSPVITAITAEDGEGSDQSAMDMLALKNLEAAMLKMTIEKARRSYAAQGHDLKTFKPSVQSNAVYMTVGGKKLAVIKATMNSNVRAVWIIGVQRDQILRVTCLRSSNHDIPIFSGECGARLTEAFGVSIKP